MDIFVGSLPFKLKESELIELFEQYGEVESAKIILDRETRQNKGFGFVTMPNDQEAEQAIEALNGAEVLGRSIVVNQSQPRPQGASRPSGGNRGGYNGGGNSSYGGNGGGNRGGSNGGGYNKRY